MLDDSFCCLRSLIFGAKNWSSIPKGAMDAKLIILWFGGGATCTLMCTCSLFIIRNVSSGYGYYNNVLTNLPELGSSSSDYTGTFQGHPVVYNQILQIMLYLQRYGKMSLVTYRTLVA